MMEHQQDAISVTSWTMNISGSLENLVKNGVCGTHIELTVAADVLDIPILIMTDSPVDEAMKRNSKFRYILLQVKQPLLFYLAFLKIITIVLKVLHAFMILWHDFCQIII